MKPGKVLIYGLIFLAAALVYYLYEIRMVGPERQKAESDKQLFDFDFEAVEEVRYQSGGIGFLFKKTGPLEWRMVRPLDTPADTWTLENMIRQALTAKRERIFKDASDNLAQYGLKPPAASLSFSYRPPGDAPNGDLKTSPLVLFGQANPTGKLLYAKIEDEPDVLALPGYLGPELKKSLFDLRDKSVLLFPAAQIDRIRIQGPDRFLVDLSKHGFRKWVLTEPGREDVDPGLVQEMIYQGLKGRVEHFQPWPPSPLEPGREKGDHEGPASRNLADFGLDVPQYSIQVFSQEKKVGDLHLGRPATPSNQEPRPWFARSDERKEIMTLDPNLVEILKKTPDELKDRHVFKDFDFRTVESLTVKTNKGLVFKAYLDDDIWEVEHPSSSTCGDMEVRSFLHGLEDLRYRRPARDGELKAQTPLKDASDLTVELSDRDQILTRLFLFDHPRPEGLLPVQIEGGRPLLIEAEPFVQKIPNDVLPFFSAPKATEKGAEPGPM